MSFEFKMVCFAFASVSGKVTTSKKKKKPTTAAFNKIKIFFLTGTKFGGDHCGVGRALQRVFATQAPSLSSSRFCHLEEGKCLAGGEGSGLWLPSLLSSIGEALGGSGSVTGGPLASR